MHYQGETAAGHSLYTLEVSYATSGLQGLSLRILPKHRYLDSPYAPKLILWAQPDTVNIVDGLQIPATPLSGVAVPS